MLYVYIHINHLSHDCSQIYVLLRNKVHLKVQNQTPFKAILHFLDSFDRFLGISQQRLGLESPSYVPNS